MRLFRTSVAAICLSLFATVITAEETLTVPLDLSPPMLEKLLARDLGMDASGQVTLRQDGCNWTRLSDMQLTPGEGGLQASFATRARIGTEVFGRCIGNGEWHGRVQVDLEPAVVEAGLAVAFRPSRTELRRPDGTDTLLTRTASYLVDSLVVPRLGQLRIDLRPSLDALDRLLADLSAGVDQESLVDRARLADVQLHDDGLEASLALRVRPPAGAIAEPPLDEEELLEWQRLEDELDGFLTVVILYFASFVEQPAMQRDLFAVLLDSRHAIAEALVGEDDGSEPDPVRNLFVGSWDRLRPHLLAMEDAGLLPDDELRIAAFMAGSDAIRALDALGPEYGFEITRDGLRRLARLLLADEAPARFTPLPLDVDPQMRRLFPPLRDIPLDDESASSSWPRLQLIRTAVAADRSAAEALRGRVARLSELDEYLGLVATLLDEEAQRRIGGGSRIPPVFRHMIDPLIRATAWKESCWRQYTGSPENPRVMTSPVGALGMMQVHARVWRGLYDVNRLANDVAYNVSAGADILDYYFVDYALRREEHLQPGGMTNLVRATYAAYNGGPGHLGRYRREGTAASLRAIDRDFWHHYQVMRRDKWPDVASCYAVN
ncbi:lytic transglycosylase domain-containing protein [Methylonatrum kenyense]|uniref:lytic transglycosylase domain-containing protein n=1 Tax=Methylonatrum kenyense TaxID=455253 RepID=UPI0020C0C6F1|nr:lytic transglycosylase domain-containing protein [Methylonatrum kenyense]MCK8516059.1 lytic transglycosylase domain-containing protein [Methylonatrum kenyense]